MSKKTKAELQHQLEQLQKENALLKQRNKELSETDITETQKIESALEVTTQFYESILENIIHGVIVTDKKNIISYANKYMGQIVGFSSEKFLGLNILIDFPVETVKNFRPFYEKAKFHLTPVHYKEIQIITPSGRTSYQSGWIIPKVKRKSFDGMIVTVEDVTDKKVLKQVFAQQEHSYKSLVNQAPVAIQIFNLNGDMIQVNKAWESLWDARSTDAVNKYNIFKDPQAEQIGLTPIFKSVLKGETHTIPEFKFSPSRSGFPGRDRWIKSIVYPVKDSFGKVLDVVFLHEDITRSKEIEASLKKSETLFSQIAITSKDMFHLNDLQGRILYANPVTEALLGYPLEEVINAPAKEFIHPEDQEIIANDMKAIFSGEEAEAKEIRLVKKDGSFLDVEVKGFLVDTESDETFIGAVLRDISDRKKAQKQLEESNISLKILLREASDAKQELEQTIISNLSTRVFPYLDDLLIKLENKPEKVYLDTIRENIEKITEGYSRRLDAYSHRLTPRETQVVDFIKQGKSNKDISLLLNVSVSTIEYYRNNIRRKLGLKNQKINLRSFLSTLK